MAGHKTSSTLLPCPEGCARHTDPNADRDGKTLKGKLFDDSKDNTALKLQDGNSRKKRNHNRPRKAAVHEGAPSEKDESPSTATKRARVHKELAELGAHSSVAPEVVALKEELESLRAAKRAQEEELQGYKRRVADLTVNMEEVAVQWSEAEVHVCKVVESLLAAKEEIAALNTHLQATRSSLAAALQDLQEERSRRAADMAAGECKSWCGSSRSRGRKE
ncbi:hypothetical protein Agub_g761 [Astrephomene gubernaculifera]|uniref:Uncharacterized protein n=1 Tax=Astrephomene gubernaculifera TaxID=47775 RepID=A0AAD3DHR0_9CHLO|nr:hypothetical protein Agub_g761 [Astrephomene gubernaculifera]